MKYVASTPDGNHLVEMSDDEMRVFVRLARTENKEGINVAYGFDPSVMPRIDLSDTFGQIIAYIETATILNELETNLNLMRQAFKNRDGEVLVQASPGNEDVIGEFVSRGIREVMGKHE